MKNRDQSGAGVLGVGIDRICTKSSERDFGCAKPRPPFHCEATRFEQLGKHFCQQVRFAKGLGSYHHRMFLLLSAESGRQQAAGSYPGEQQKRFSQIHCHARRASNPARARSISRATYSVAGARISSCILPRCSRLPFLITTTSSASRPASARS